MSATVAPSTEHSLSETLGRLQRGAAVDEALAFYDRLAPVGVEEMSGRWRGSGLATGHPLDGLLERYGWHGKRFDGPDGAHPLVFGRADRLFNVNPALVPMGLLARAPGLLDRRCLAAVGRALLRLAATSAPKARVRMIEYRGVLTATMSYDALAINDHFRRVDEATLLGAMDMRGVEQPFLFVLRR